MVRPLVAVLVGVLIGLAAAALLIWILASRDDSATRQDNPGLSTHSTYLLAA